MITLEVFFLVIIVLDVYKRQLFINAKLDFSAFGLGVSIENAAPVTDIENALELMLKYIMMPSLLSFFNILVVFLTIKAMLASRSSSLEDSSTICTLAFPFLS